VRLHLPIMFQILSQKLVKSVHSRSSKNPKCLLSCKMHFFMSFIHKYVSSVCKGTHKVPENKTLSLFCSHFSSQIALKRFSSEEVGAWSTLRSPRVVELFGVVREGPNVMLFMDLKSGKQSFTPHSASAHC